MGVASGGFDGAPNGFGWAVALLASAVVLVPLTSRTLFQAGGKSAKKVVSLLFKKSVTGLPYGSGVERPVPHKLCIVPCH